MAEKKDYGTYAYIAVILGGLSFGVSCYVLWSAWGLDGKIKGDTFSAAYAIGRLDIIAICLALVAVTALIAAFPFARFIKMAAEKEAAIIAEEVARRVADQFISQNFEATQLAEKIAKQVADVYSSGSVGAHDQNRQEPGRLDIGPGDPHIQEESSL